MKAANQSVSLLSETGPACKVLTSIKSLYGGKNVVFISLYNLL